MRMEADATRRTCTSHQHRALQACHPFGVHLKDPAPPVRGSFHLRASFAEPRRHRQHDARPETKRPPLGAEQRLASRGSVPLDSGQTPTVAEPRPHLAPSARLDPCKEMSAGNEPSALRNGARLQPSNHEDYCTVFIGLRCHGRRAAVRPEPPVTRRGSGVHFHQRLPGLAVSRGALC
jgi:hypothetical protein